MSTSVALWYYLHNKTLGLFEELARFIGVYVTVLVAKYSEKKRVYTISFNEAEEIVGLFIK